MATDRRAADVVVTRASESVHWGGGEGAGENGEGGDGKEVQKFECCHD